MRLHQIWIYPVKSMVGGTVDAADLDDLGLVGDRIWAVRDLERGGLPTPTTSSPSCAACSVAPTTNHCPISRSFLPR
jgi:uncharacterized protein YcbX